MFHISEEHVITAHSLKDGAEIKITPRPKLEVGTSILKKIGKYVFSTNYGLFGAISIVAFPDLADVAEFKQAAQGAMHAGPANINKGAVGSLMLDNSKDEIILKYAQAHYKTTGEFGLPRRLATKYGGWRVSAFVHAINLAKKNKKVY